MTGEELNRKPVEGIDWFRACHRAMYGGPVGGPEEYRFSVLGPFEDESDREIMLGLFDLFRRQIERMPTKEGIRKAALIAEAGSEGRESMYGSDIEYSKTQHEYKKCSCQNLESHCWYCGLQEDDSIHVKLEAKHEGS